LREQGIFNVKNKNKLQKAIAHIEHCDIIEEKAKGERKMYLKKSYMKRTGRTYLSMVHGYWDKAKGYSRSRVVESFGYLGTVQN